MKAFTFDTWFTQFDEHYDLLIKMVKINHGEPPGKIVQPQELYGSDLG